MKQNCLINTNAGFKIKRCVLVVVQQIELRARIACVLQSAGYAVELADNQKRAIELAAAKQIEAAIVVDSSELDGLEKELRDHVPRTIVLGHRTDENPSAGAITSWGRRISCAGIG